MSTTFNLQEIERKVQRSFYQDGLMEILAGFYLIQKPNLSQAVAMAQQAVRITPTAQNFDLLAEAQWRNRDLVQAKAAAQEALKRAPFDRRIQALHQKVMGNP